MPKLQITNSKGLVQKTGSTNAVLQDDVLSGLKKKFLAKTANYDVLASDSDTIIQVNPAGTTLIQLPAAATVGAGWNVTIVVTEDNGGNMANKVNIGAASGEFFNGIIFGGDAGGSSVADGTDNDFITLSTSAKSGERFDIFSDGTRMHATGYANDVSNTVFADDAG